MNLNSTAIEYECFRKASVIFAIILAMPTFPMQIVMAKILIQRIQLKLPRHKILLSLTISDSIQITFVAFLQLLGLFFQLKTTSLGCQVIRKIIELVVTSTVIWASGSIVALAFERYVACVHVFRFQEIITNKFINRILSCIWAVGLICGFIDKKRYQPNLTMVTLPLTETFNIIYAVIVVLSSAILTFVQIRLYLISKQINKTRPGIRFGRAEEAHFVRIRQLKISIAASAVVVLYVACMCPLAFYNLFHVFQQQIHNTSRARVILLFFAATNTFVDSFVYGFGMADTRKALKEEIQKMRVFFYKMICRVVEQEG